jgi:hypothetical protein
MQLHQASPAFLGALVALALSSGSVPAQMPDPSQPQRVPSWMLTIRPAAQVSAQELSPIEFRNERVKLLMDELERESPTAAAMLQTIRKLGFPMSVGSFDDLEQEMQEEYSSWTRSTRSAAGYMAPVVRPGAAFSGQLTTVKINVAVNLTLLDELFDNAPTDVPDAGVTWKEIQRLETLAVLGHELVHAYGLAISGGDPRVGCHDPFEGQSTQVSCVMIGENILRSEIGAPLDWDYGFPSARSLAGRYQAVSARAQALQEIAAFRLPQRFELPPLQVPDRRPLGN